MWTAIGLLIGTSVFLYYLIKLYTHRNSDYWTKQNVVTLKNDLTLLEVVTGKRAPVDFDMQYYRDLGDEKFGGTLELGNPILFVKDLDLVKNVFVKDFDHFVDHRRFIDTDPLMSKGLFFLHGQEWKDMRSFLSPTFTSGKIRRMFHYFEQSSQKLLDYVSKHNPKTNGGYNVNMPEIANRFTLDVIGATAFGMEVDCLKNVDSLFYNMANRVSELSLKRIVRFGINNNFPSVGNFLNFHVLDSDVTEFYLGLLTQAFRARDGSSKGQRDDVLQLLKETAEENLKSANDAATDNNASSNDGKKSKVQLTEDVAIQHAFVFFFAGFDTVASLIGETSYLLAVHPEVQEKIFAEVDEIMQLSDGKVTYENVNRMDYLEMTIAEVLRLYPIVTRLERKCTVAYQIPGTDVTIPEGMIVAIPAEGIQRDEKYYPDPLTFDPERFNAENKASRNQYAYMPFGIGPRNCIGMRFALIEIKVALAHLIHNFTIQPTDKTPIPVHMQKILGFSRAPIDLELRLVPRK